MKKLFSSLPFRLILGIVVGVLLGQVFTESIMKVVVTLQYIMGHSDISVTLNTYTHLTFDDAQAEFDRVAEEKAEAKRLHEAYLDQLSRSKADADAQAAEVLKRAEETVRAMQAQAQTDAEELLSRARQQARREHADATAQLRRDMADIAVDIAGRVIGREVTEKDNADIIDAYFDAICAEAQGGTGT